MIATIENTTGSSATPDLNTPASAAPARSRIRVWLTDDNIGFRNSLAELLARSGEFDCKRQFHSAESLLEGLAADEPPDVILLDVEMGGMKGVDALRPIRALAPDVRVLIITSFFDPMYESCASRDGASAFLIKAYAPQNLVGEIHRALASPVHLVELRTNEVACLDTQNGSMPGQTKFTEAIVVKGWLSRLTVWLTGVATALLDHAPVHRPATTPD